MVWRIQKGQDFLILTFKRLLISVLIERIQDKF